MATSLQALTLRMICKPLHVASDVFYGLIYSCVCPSHLEPFLTFSVPEASHPPGATQVNIQNWKGRIRIRTCLEVESTDHAHHFCSGCLLQMDLKGAERDYRGHQVPPWVPSWCTSPSSLPSRSSKTLFPLTGYSSMLLCTWPMYSFFKTQLKYCLWVPEDSPERITPFSFCTLHALLLPPGHHVVYIMLPVSDSPVDWGLSWRLCLIFVSSGPGSQSPPSTSVFQHLESSLTLQRTHQTFSNCLLKWNQTENWEFTLPGSWLTTSL